MNITFYSLYIYVPIILQSTATLYAEGIVSMHCSSLLICSSISRTSCSVFPLGIEKTMFMLLLSNKWTLGVTRGTKSFGNNYRKLLRSSRRECIAGNLPSGIFLLPGHNGARQQKLIKTDPSFYQFYKPNKYTIKSKKSNLNISKSSHLFFECLKSLKSCCGVITRRKMPMFGRDSCDNVSIH